MPKLYKRVQLLGLPLYYQGTHDSLCTYYSAAMLLASLHPEYHAFFGRGVRRRKVGLEVDDPLVKYFPHSAKETKDHVLATWFYRGAYLKDACRALNASMKADKRDTRFKYEQFKNLDSTFKIIVDKIDQGLPIMAGWTTVDLGVHCVLVIGYRKESRNWLILNDPNGGNEVCWDVLKSINKFRLELVSVENHDGPRPDRLTEVLGAKKPRQIDRWWPCRDNIYYRPIDELYESAKHSLPCSSQDA
jgi:hypothetical protein